MALLATQTLPRKPNSVIFSFTEEHNANIIYSQGRCTDKLITVLVVTGGQELTNSTGALPHTVLVNTFCRLGEFPLSNLASHEFFSLEPTEGNHIFLLLG